MERKKLGVLLVAWAGSALAVTGYLMGDPANGKLILFPQAVKANPNNSDAVDAIVQD